MKPTTAQLKNAPEHIAWEFASMLAAALEMVKPHHGPLNHQVQEVFLLHLRNLEEFFRGGIVEFEAAIKKAPPPPCPILPRGLDNIYAVDFCSSISWDYNFLKGDLIAGINKTLSHMTYSRDGGVPPFDGRFHLHGTMTFMRKTWDEFLKELRPEFRGDLLHWLHRHTREDDKWGLRPLNGFENRFEEGITALVKKYAWELNKTSVGLIPSHPYSPDFPYSV